jgi:membrane protein DedA with SNARE-associated domain
MAETVWIGDFPLLEQLQALADAILDLAQANLYLAIVLMIGIEEAGVPLPIPGDSILVFAGYEISQGRANLLIVLGCAVAATVGGASVLYWAARLGGHSMVLRYGKYIRLDHARLMRMERFMQRNAAWAIIIGRLVPGLRIVTTVGAGVFLVPYPKFVVYTTISTLIWAFLYIFLGSFIGERIDVIRAFVISNPLLVIVVLVATVVGLLLVRRNRRRNRPNRDDGEVTTSLAEGLPGS